MSAPPRVAPMLTGGVGLPPDRRGWLVEPKWDGIRAIVTIAGGRVDLRSRNDNDVSAAYPELASPPPSLAGHDAVLDAEVIAIEPSGAAARFGSLQRRMHVRHPSPALVAEVPVTAVVFDVLWLDGRSLLDEPLTARREALGRLAIGDGRWATSPLLDLDVDETLYETGRELGLEGFVLKRSDSAYLPGRRSETWRKVKCLRRREFVVGGWSEGRGARSGSLGSLAVGLHVPGLRFVGMVGSGLTGADVDAFAGSAAELARVTSPFINPTPAAVRFLEPLIVVEVAFTEVTAAGTLRHPVLAGFRTDIDAAHVIADAEVPELFGNYTG